MNIDWLVVAVLWQQFLCCSASVALQFYQRCMQVSNVKSQASLRSLEARQYKQVASELQVRK